MSALNREDLISDDLLKAPGILKAELQDLLTTINSIAKSTVAYSEANKTVDTTLTGVTKDTEQMIIYQKQLAAVQNQLAVASAKSSTEYQGYKKTIQEVNDVSKRKLELGDRDAKSVTAQNASIKELGAALNANRVAYAKLTNEFDRNGKEGKELLTIIQKQDEEYKALRKSIGQSQDNVGDYEGAMKALKIELKAANDALVGIAKELGTDSEAYRNAALRAGDLRDQIGDLKEDTASVSGEPIERFAGSFELLQNKVKTLDFKGATNAVKQMTSATKSLTFSEASKGIGSFGKAIGGFGKALLTNPIFLIAAAIALITIAVVKFHDKLKPLQLIFEVIGAAVDFVIQSLKDLSDFMGLSAFAAEEAATRIADAYKQARESLVEYYETEITIANAAGANSLVLELQKQQAINETSRVQIKALDDYQKKTLTTFDKVSIAVKAFLGMDVSDSFVNKLTEDQQKMYDEAKQLQKDSITQIKALELQDYVSRLKLNNDYIRQRKDNQFELDKFTITSALNAQQKIADDNATYEDKRNNAARQAAKFRDTLAQMEAAHQKSLLQDQFIELKQQLETELSLVIQDEARRNEIISRFRQLEIDLSSNIAKKVTLIDKQKNEAIKKSAEKLFTDLNEIAVYTLEFNRDIQDNITDDESKSFDKRLQALSNATQLEYQIIQRNEDDLLISGEAARQKRLDNEKNFKDKYLQIVYQRIASEKKLQDGNDIQDDNSAFESLEKSYQKRQISTRSYLRQKKVLQDEAFKNEIGSAILAEEKLRDINKALGQSTFDNDVRISELKRALREKEGEDIVAYREELNAKLEELGQAAFDSAVTIGQNLFDAQDQKRQENLERLTKNYEDELALSEGNAQAQNDIRNRFAAEQDKIRLQQAAADRKRAQFEKATAVLSIAINTAKGIGQALGNYPPPASFIFAAIVGALGAVQLAAVLSKPIPSYAVGTENHKGGPARVGEIGSELVVLPSGQEFLTPSKTTIMDLPKGTKVKRHDDMLTQMAIAGLSPNDSTQGNVMDLSGLRSDIKELTHTVRTKKHFSFNITKKGVEAMAEKGFNKNKMLNDWYA